MDGEGSIAISPDGKTAYVLTINPDTVVPISTATNRAGTPVNLGVSPPDVVGLNNQIAITPDGNTVYVPTNEHSVIPVSTATNTRGRPIQFGAECRTPPHAQATGAMVITPNGNTAYVTCDGAVVPISTASNTPGKPVHVPLRIPITIAITP